jgi:hypothetical protein
MIHLEILTSPDKNVETSFQFFQNQVYLGHSLGNLQIKDAELKTSHLMIEVVEKDLIIHPQKDVESYLIDGKRASNVRKIKASQIITMGKTTFRVVSFEETTFPSKKAILDDKLNQLVETNSPRLNAIEKLTKLMK